MSIDNLLHKAHKVNKPPHWCVDHQKWETEPHDESKTLEKWVMVKGDKPEQFGPDPKVNLGETIGVPHGIPVKPGRKGEGPDVKVDGGQTIGWERQIKRPSVKDPSKELNDAVARARAKKAKENPGVIDRIKRLFNKDVGEELSSRVQNLGGPVKPKSRPKRDEHVVDYGEMANYSQPGVRTNTPVQTKTMLPPKSGETPDEWWARNEGKSRGGQ